MRGTSYHSGTLLLISMLVVPAGTAAQDTDALYQGACDEGDLSACNVFGLMLELGQGVPQDEPRARRLYRRACEGGDLVGCTNLGLMYEGGVGGPRDVDEAVGRYRIACEGSEQLACDLLASLEGPGDSDERTFLKAGRVSDAETTTALSDAIVELPELGIREVSDEQGMVSLGRLTEGTYALHVERAGYEVLDGELQVPGGSQFLALLNRSQAEDASEPGRIEGQVFDDSGGTLSDVDVDVVGREGARALTNQQGRYLLADLEPGLIQVRFTRLGYAPRTATLIVQPGRTVDIETTLRPEAIELEAIEVTVRSRFLEQNGYYRRSRRGVGAQISRQDLERLQPFQLSDVMFRVPGVRLSDTRMLPGSAVYAIHPTIQTPANGPCIMDLYVDGVRAADPDLNQIPADWLEGVEVYAGGNTPAEYSTLNPCGVVLLWTRR